MNFDIPIRKDAGHLFTLQDHEHLILLGQLRRLPPGGDVDVVQRALALAGGQGPNGHHGGTGAANTNHGKINADLGAPNDPCTAEVLSFLQTVLAK